MRKKLLFLTAIVFLFVNSYSQAPAVKLHYPVTRKCLAEDNYFGVYIADPYRWLENDTLAETVEWIKKQNELTQGYFKTVTCRDTLKKRLVELCNYDRVSLFSRYGKHYFYYQSNGLQNHWALYMQDAETDSIHVLLDPATIDTTGITAITHTAIRNDGRLVAYLLSKAGSDWAEIHILDVETGQTLPDVIKWVKLTKPSWQGNGFYYSAFDRPDNAHPYSAKNENNKVFFHKLGTNQNTDSLVYANKQNKFIHCDISISPDGKVACLQGSTYKGKQLSLKTISPESEWKDLTNSGNNDYRIIEYLPDNSVLVLTNNYASNYRLIKVNTKHPATGWKEVLPAGEDVLEDVVVSGNKIIASYSHRATTHLRVFSITGQYERDIEFNQPGTAFVNGNILDSIAYIAFTNYITPVSIYRYNVNTGIKEVFWQNKNTFNSNQYETKQVFFKGRDGVIMPMSLTCKKGTKIDGNAPCFLEGYGGFGQSMVPFYFPAISLFLEAGGIYAVANIRGGYEYGSDWHKYGMGMYKQNVFDDFISAAEYLIRNKYTSTKKLAIYGASNGGLLIGAVMTQRPDLARVAIPSVGVLDMLRYHKFTVGHFWSHEYGTSDKDYEFEYLLKYSPLHNLKEADYPATLITTGDHDDRVVPAHSFKFAATLQEKQKGNNPTLIRIDVNAGHGGGKPTSKLIDEWTDIWSFVFTNLDMKY